MASRGRGARSGRQGERRSIVQAMRARGRGRRSPPFELAGSDNNALGVSSTASLQQIFKQARASGALNLTSRGLEEIPDEVFNLIDGVDALQGEKFWEVCELQRLDLSFNQIATLPNQVSTLSRLVSLKIRKNKLTVVPLELFSLEQLSLLDLTGNAIRELPEELGRAVALTGLLLAGNRLSTLPGSIGNLVALETLELSDNNLVALPDSLGKLIRLAKLTASNNGARLSRLPESLSGLSCLTLLDVSRNAIELFPDGMSRLTALTLLDARENKLKEMPRLPQSNKLAQVFVGFNSISTLDGAILLRVSGGLTEFHIQSNHIVHLPEEVGSLAKLKTFDASNNDISELPAALGYLPELNRLLVDGNPLRTIRRTLLTGGASSLKKYLRTRGPRPSYPGLDAAEEGEVMEPGEGGVSADGNVAVLRNAMETSALDLEDRGLTSLSPALFEDDRTLAAVTRAKLSGNKLKTLPEAISRFQKLGSLEADRNEISSLPATLSLVALQRLSVRRNSLSSPAAVDAFLAPPQSSPSLAAQGIGGPPGSLPLARSICELDLSSNGLETMPESIFSCRSLQTLVMGYNLLSDLSGMPWAALRALETLDLSNNRVRELGDVVLMTWLRRLNVENNELNPVPLELGLCTALESLLLAGNPQRQVSASILQKGTSATLRYMKERLPPGHRPRVAAVPLPPPPSAIASSAHGPKAGTGQTIAEEAVRPGATRGTSTALSSMQQGNKGAAPPDETEALAKIAALRAEVGVLMEELEAPGISQAKTYAMKKKLQMKRAEALREERALKARQKSLA